VQRLQPVASVVSTRARCHEPDDKRELPMNSARPSLNSRHVGLTRSAQRFTARQSRNRSSGGSPACRGGRRLAAPTGVHRSRHGYHSVAQSAGHDARLYGRRDAGRYTRAALQNPRGAGGSGRTAAQKNPETFLCGTLRISESSALRFGSGCQNVYE